MFKASIFKLPDCFLAPCMCEKWNNMNKEDIEAEVSRYKKINFNGFSADIVDFSITRPCFSSGHDVYFQIKSDRPLTTFDEPQEVTFS